MDEVWKIAKNYVKTLGILGSDLDNITSENLVVWGYNKSQETHPNSDEDMIDFAEWIDKNKFSILTINNEWVSELLPYSGCLYTTKELIQIWREQQSKIVYYNE